MGRRGAKSKTTNGDIESVAVAAAEAEIEENQEHQEEFVQNGDDPLAEVDDEDEDDKPLKKKLPKKRGAPANAKKKGKKAKKDKSAEEENDNDEAEPEEILPTDEEPVYEVDKIMDVQYLKSGAREFLIRWKNHGPESDTWEPEENLSCPDLIAKFTDKMS
ncbi:chromodomain Y-like protein [Ctenocephalides felis]|uniref:chromodomain Y-like protein n=1 Tax=Ctenocephalides felis TaxID=7515 RepID=UPI000E6E210E|nr:chromodomain Y-like protein [Ctenocephalides felis]